MHQVSNGYSSLITADGSTTITVTSATGLPATFPYWLDISNAQGGIVLERVEISGATGTTLTCSQRAIVGTQTNQTGHYAEIRVLAETIIEVVNGVNKVKPENGRTRDRKNIQDAITDAEANGKSVELGNGTFLLSPDGLSSPTYLLLLQKNGAFLGKGPNTKLVVTSDVASTTDVIAFKPSELVNGYQLGNFNMLAQSTKCARHGIHFDLTNAIEGSQWIWRAKISEIVFSTNIAGSMGTANCWNGYDVRLTVGTGVVDAFFCNVFENIRSGNGMYFDKLGDSCSFQHINLHGDPAAAISVGIIINSMMNSANVCSFYDINGYGPGYKIYFNGDKIYMNRCNMEMPANIVGALACVYIAQGTVQSIIENCNISSYDTVTGAHGCLISGGVRTKIRNNVFNVLKSGFYGLQVDASCTQTVLDGNLYAANDNVQNYALRNCLDTTKILSGGEV